MADMAEAARSRRPGLRLLAEALDVLRFGPHRRSACLVALPPAAFAHASLVRAEPADGAMLAETPGVLTLMFNEPVSPLVMRLIGPGGEVIAPPATAENSVVTVHSAAAAAGHACAELARRVGRRASGRRVVHVLDRCCQRSLVAVAPSTGDAVVRSALWAAKVVVYAGLFLGIGGVFFRTWIRQCRTRGTAASLSHHSLPASSRRRSRSACRGSMRSTCRCQV